MCVQTSETRCSSHLEHPAPTGVRFFKAPGINCYRICCKPASNRAADQAVVILHWELALENLHCELGLPTYIFIQKFHPADSNTGFRDRLVDLSKQSSGADNFEWRVDRLTYRVGNGPQTQMTPKNFIRPKNQSRNPSFGSCFKKVRISEPSTECDQVNF